MNFTSTFARISGAFSGRNDDLAYKTTEKAKRTARDRKTDPKQFLL